MFVATVTVETNGAIPNHDIHVATPLARIIAQAFAFATSPRERIMPDVVKIEFRDNIVLESGTVVAITIETNYDAKRVANVEQLKTAIAQAIYDSAMFKCRNTPGTVRIELHLGVQHVLAHT